MKEHEKRCKVTAGQGINFPPKRGVGGSNPLWDARNNAVSLCFQGFTAFFVQP